MCRIYREAVTGLSPGFQPWDAVPPSPMVRQQSVHEKLERMLKHDRQQDQAQIGSRTEDQHG